MAVQASSSSSPCASAFTCEYDAYLSFRGMDTRLGFTRNLYFALEKKGVNAYLDEINLEVGEEIIPSLITAVEKSRTAIIVLSLNYATSSYCLDELVRILDCVKGHGRLVIPVFYCVDPSDVRHRKGAYEYAFASHERRFNDCPENLNDNMERLRKWKIALKQVADLSGYHFKQGYGYEHELTVKIAEQVSNIRRAALPAVGHQIGLDSKVQSVISLGDFGSNDARMVGNHGIGEIGQSTSTTLRVIANRVYRIDNTIVDSIPETANVVVANNLTTVQPHATAPATNVVASVRPFPNVSNIETFKGQNFKRWQERVLSLLDMHGMANILTNPKPKSFAGPKNLDDWIHANKVCRHTILSTLSNELFDVYHSYKEANKIWESMVLTYSTQDTRRQKFVIENYYSWEMIDDKDIQVQIDEHHKLLENLKAEDIILQDEFVAELLIEKLPDSWKDYKQQLRHKNQPLSLADLVTHIITEDTNRKEIKEARAKALVSRVNVLQAQRKRYDGKMSNSNYNKPSNFPRAPNPTFKKSGGCFVCGKAGHRAAQCHSRATKNENPPRPRKFG